MGTYAQTATDRWMQRAILVAAGLLAVAVLGLAGLFLRERYTQPASSLADRQVEQARSAVRADPESLDARVQLGDAYLGKKMYREALEQFREVIRVNEYYQAALIGAGVAALRTRQEDQALEYFQKVVELTKRSDFVSVDRRLNGVYYELGRIYLSRSRIDEAAESLKNALMINRTDSDALLLLGNALVAKGELDEALDAYRKATLFVPDFVDAYQGVVLASEKKGDANTAAYGRAMVAFSSGKVDESIRGLEAVAPKMTDFPDVWVGLGFAYEAKGQKAKALEAFERVLTIEPLHKIAKSKVERLSQK